MNKAPDLDAIAAAAWPDQQLPEALTAVARRLGIADAPLREVRHSGTSTASVDDASGWVEENAGQVRLQADQTFAALDELDAMFGNGAPLIVRLSFLDGAPYLIVVGSEGSQLLALDRRGRTSRISVASLVRSIREPFEQPLEGPVTETLDRLGVQGRRRTRARASLLRDRLANVRFRGCWLLRLPPGSGLKSEASAAHLAVRAATLVGSYVGQYACFLGSWWLLGQAVLEGSATRGWLLGWALLLVSMLPLRLLVTWEQGLLTISVGAWLRRRLLRGAFVVNRQLIRHKGVGQLFTLVMEAASLDAMALSGGLAAAFAALEIVGAGVVMWFGATSWLIVALVVWFGLAASACALYLTRRHAWTAQRITMTHDLLESMMGHRTRLIQQPAADRHRTEDDALDRALVLGDAMDRAGLWLVAFVPRGWLVVALASLIPALASGALPAALAISLGGVLLAFRALQRLAAGLTNLAGAVVASRSIQALAAAATPRESALVRSARHTGGESLQPAIQARDLVFRYRPQGEPVIANATLSIERGARLLLEGGSGSGKTTFAALLSGLERPESGLLLAGGLDPAALGAHGWRSRIVMAPQAHDNYLVGGSLAFNLLMGRRWPAEKSDLRDAEDVCRELGLGDLIDRLPAGLDQVVGETGWQLSQGERVRVFLARALLQRPDVLILDESFSALDPENLEKAARTVTASPAAVLAIAHL